MDSGILDSISIKKSVPVFIVQVLDKIMITAGFIILARLLRPVDFGMAFLAQAFVAFFTLVKTSIFDAALIQDRDDSDDMYRVGFTSDFILALMLFAAIYSLAPALANFYGSEELKAAIRIYGIVILIESFVLVPKTRLIKKFRFFNVNAINLCITLVRIGASVIFALMGFAFWSILYGSMASLLVSVAAFFLVKPWQIKPCMDLRTLKKLLNYGKYILIINLVGFAMSEMSGIAIGKIVGIAAAGFLAVAYRWGFWIFNNLFSFMEYILFPVSSRYREDGEGIRTMYRKTFSLSALIVFPISSGIFLLAPEFVKIILGPEWLPIIVPLRILSIAGLVHFLGYISNPFLKGLGYVRVESHRIYLNIVLLSIFLFPLSRLYGVVGASVAILSSAALTQTVFYIYSAKFLKIDKLESGKSLYVPFIASSFLGLALLSMKHFIFHSDIKGPVEFFVLAGAALCVYFLAALFLEKRARQ